MGTGEKIFEVRGHEVRSQRGEIQFSTRDTRRLTAVRSFSVPRRHTLWRRRLMAAVQWSSTELNTSSKIRHIYADWLSVSLLSLLSVCQHENITRLEIRSMERGICPIAMSTINKRTVPIIIAECMAHEREAIFPLPV